jgi:ferredoxin
MATLNERLPTNVVGPFYVDSSCVDCDLCRNTAPEIFRRDEETGHSFVYRQPQSPAEIALAEDARVGCPTESIGNDAPQAPEAKGNATRIWALPAITGGKSC